MSTLPSRNQTLLETIRQGLFLASTQKTVATLGDRATYLGLSEISKYAECPRAAVAAKIGRPVAHLERLLTTQRGHWFEDGVKDALTFSGLRHFHQLEINLKRRSGHLKAHLDFTLVWNEPIKAVRILEVKSTEKLPESPWNSHVIQAQGQVTLLRQFWNKPVFSLRNENGDVLKADKTFPELCKEQLGLEISSRPSSISIESWLLYLSMRDAKAFGPFIYSPDSYADILSVADVFHNDLKAVGEDRAKLQELTWPRGFYPLCAYCDFNVDCPKFAQGSYQPEWEASIRRLNELKSRQTELHAEITEIEAALKQAHGMAQTKDWIETGAHRFRMSMVSGRKSLDQEALKRELADIFHGMGSEIDVNSLFAACTKQGAPFPRLTISQINT